MKKIYWVIIGISLFLLLGFWIWSGSSAHLAFLHPNIKFASWALALGAISAISLPLGALAGIIFKPKPFITAGLTAFGAGALLAALSVELIAPTVMEIVGQTPNSYGMATDKQHAFFTLGALIVGCILGGVFFIVLDDMVNSQGGFARKVSTVIAYFKGERKTSVEEELKTEDDHVMDLASVKKEVKEHSNGPMAIWLGLLIDGIPESFVIGAGFLSILSGRLAAGESPEFASVIPYTLIAGLFLSNFPEAFSSSIGMKKQGMSTGKVLMLWFSLVIIIAVGSTIGYYLGAEIPHEIEIGIEGLAAGAMLTMIAQTMIPEAVHIGGNKIVGISTLFGYLAAVAFKLFE